MLGLYLANIMEMCLISQTLLQEIVHVTSNMLQFSLLLDLTNDDFSRKTNTWDSNQSVD